MKKRCGKVQSISLGKQAKQALDEPVRRKGALVGRWFCYFQKRKKEEKKKMRKKGVDG